MYNNVEQLPNFNIVSLFFNLFISLIFIFSLYFIFSALTKYFKILNFTLYCMSAPITTKETYKSIKEISEEEFIKVLFTLKQEKIKNIQGGRKMYPVAVDYKGIKIIELPHQIVMISKFEHLMIKVKDVINSIIKFINSAFKRLETIDKIRVQYSIDYEYDEKGFPILKIHIKNIEEVGGAYTILDKSILKQLGYPVEVGEEMPEIEGEVKEAKVFEEVEQKQ